MWARVVEVMLGCWLVVSPFIFRHAPEREGFWFNDLFGGIAVVTLALLSFWPLLRRAHLATGLLALWFIGFGFLASPHPAPPALQNDIAVGLLLLMFAIIPNEANQPPQSWRSFSASPSLPRKAESPPERGQVG